VLSIGKLGQGQEAYYVETVAAGAEEYYVGAGEAPGPWTGRSAARLGLTGEVDGADLAALLGHLAPSTGEPLTAGLSAPKVAGFDLTFCAPKSVSLRWAFGSRDVAADVVAAHEAAVAAAFAVMEGEAARVRRGKAGCRGLDAEGLVAAAFRHRTSRAGDPHLHTHAVVANIGFLDEDGRWSALDARPLYRWAQAVGYLYEAHLRHELSRRLGVGWGPVRRGIADLAGTPRPAIDAFSTRRQEILEHLEAHGVAGGRAAQVATYATRRAKGSVPPTGDLRERWAAHAFALGLDLAAVGDPAAHMDYGATAASAPIIFDELAGPAGVTERRSTFDRRDV
jgi:conjugative relaxase-like TrwC/TraI family protein